MNALAYALLTLPFQANDVATVLFKDDDILQTSTGPHAYQILEFAPGRGLDGGWVTWAHVFSGTTIQPQSVLLGRLSTDPIDSVRILREPQTIGGFVQSRIRTYGSAVRGTSIAYFAESASSIYIWSLWKDDQLLAINGDVIPGTTRRWVGFISVYQTSSGGLLVLGIGEGISGGGQYGNLLFDWTSQQVVIAEKTSFPGLPAPIDYFQQLPVVSPNGQHWAAIVRILGTSDDAVIVDGAVYDFGIGLPAIRGLPVPATLTSVPPGGLWNHFSTVSVNDRGEVALEARTLTNHVFQRHFVRNGVPANAMSPSNLTLSMKAADGRGAILASESGTRTLFVENSEVYPATLGIDVDGDGIADPSWVFASQTSNAFVTPIPGAPTIFHARIRNGGSPFSDMDAILSVRTHRMDEATCDGERNSTGRAAELVVTGDRRASANELVLQAHGLPQQTVGFFLMSTTPGLTIGPGGSSGNLCLAGSIGRLTTQVFDTGAFDQGAGTLDLTAIPQPNGSVGAIAGDTWHFQAWYRDTLQGSPTSNFSAARSVTFL